MENIIIKLFILIFLWLNIQPQPIFAKEEVNQLFYMFNGESIVNFEENIDMLSSENIRVILMINPEINLHVGQIKRIQNLQEEYNLDIILQKEDEFSQTPFVTKGYDKNIQLAGVYQKNTEELIYEGKDTISFKKIYLPLDPIEVLEEKKQLSNKNNNAICVDENNFNISNILLFTDQLNDKNLDLTNYTYEIKEVGLIYQIFIYIGDISIVLFSFAIIILIAAIVIFRKWSLLNFQSRT